MVRLLLALIGTAHPIHSSSAVISQAPGAPVATILLRVFGDDFPPHDDPVSIARYLATHFLLHDRRGKPVELHLETVRTQGAVLLLELTAPIPEGLAGSRVWHGVLAERFDDQVNIVQAHYAGRAVSLLFTAGEGAKPLP